MSLTKLASDSTTHLLAPSESSPSNQPATGENRPQGDGARKSSTNHVRNALASLGIGARPQASSSGRGQSVTLRRPQKFPDGSVRPDFLVASRIDTGKAPSITVKSTDPALTGKALPSNSFGLPKWRMSTTDAEAHTDGHMHPWNYVQRGLTLRESLTRMDEIGLRYSTAMPIPTSMLAMNLDKKTDRSVLSISAEVEHDPEILDHSHDVTHHCGTLNHYYVPDRHKDITVEDLRRNPQILKDIVEGGELYVDTSVDHRTADEFKSADLNQAERSRFDPMMTGLHLGDPRATDGLLRTLFGNKGVFTGVGEVTIGKELVQDLFAGKAQAHLHKNIESFKDLVANVGKIGMPVVLHCDAYDLHDQLRASGGDAAHSGGTSSKSEGKKPAGPSQLDGLSKLFDDPKVQNTTIVWAHAGGLGRFVMEESGHTNALQRMLDKHPNLNLDISWSRVAEQLIRSPESRDKWAAFLIKNSDRIVFGSDTLAPPDRQTWEATKIAYQDLFNHIEEQPGGKGVMHQILNDNYERIFVGAREKVRDFENKVLTPKFYENALVRPEIRDSRGQIFNGVDGLPIKRMTPEFLQHEIDLAANRT